MKTIITVLAFIMTLGLSAQLPETLDEVAPFSEGLAAIRKGKQWAFIDELGNIIIDFRDDIYWNPDADQSLQGVKGVRFPQFSNGLCMVRTFTDDIAVYGFINTEGELVVEHEFLNVNPFKNGVTTGIIYEKVFRGQNEFKLDIYEFKFHEVIIDDSGKIIEFLGRRYNIQMKKSRYNLPTINTKILNDKIVAFKTEGNWAIRKLNL